MKTIATVIRNCKSGRKPLSFRTTQTLYGVSILLTFLAAGRLGAIG